MSVQPDPYNLKPYCSTEDVATFFEKVDDFDEDTNPSAKRVQRMIYEKSDWIDNFTGHAWRERRVVDEMKNLEGPYRWRSGTPIKLMHRDIRTPLDPEKGDKLEFWHGNEYRDWVEKAQFNEGRGQDFWIEHATGMLHIYRRAMFWRRYREVKITYRYGKEQTPMLIRNCCAKLVAADLLRSQQYRLTVPGNEEAPDASTIADRWEENIKEDLEPYKEVRAIGGA